MLLRPTLQQPSPDVQEQQARQPVCTTSNRPDSRMRPHTRQYRHAIGLGVRTTDMVRHRPPRLDHRCNAVAAGPARQWVHPQRQHLGLKLHCQRGQLSQLPPQPIPHLLHIRARLGPDRPGSDVPNGKTNSLRARALCPDRPVTAARAAERGSHDAATDIAATRLGAQDQQARQPA